jgi:hypothetical protein
MEEASVNNTNGKLDARFVERRLKNLRKAYEKEEPSVEWLCLGTKFL